MSREPEKFTVLYEDPHLIVLNKPAGLLSQGGRGSSKNLVDLLRRYFGRDYVGMVHRLDRNTSGLMIVAKRTKAARRLTLALQKGQISRSYEAFLVGAFRGLRTWHHWLLKDSRTNEVRVRRKRAGNAKEARMRALSIARGRWGRVPLTQASLSLETGRSHQIRVQAAAEGLPVLGDRKYGEFCGEEWNRAAGRPLLHSAEIRFPHPMSGKEMKFQVPLPEDMLRIRSEAHFH